STQDVMVGINAALEEVERVKRFGFSDAELERAKKNALSGFERSWNNRDKTESADFVDEYIRNFTDEEPVPGIDEEFNLMKKLLPQISSAEVNEVTNFFKDEANRFSYVTGPDAALKYKLPSSEQLVALLDVKANDKNIKPYEEKAVSTVLLTNMPKAGKVTSTKNDEVLATTELVLSNGVKVTLKQTDFKNDQILFSAFRFG
ncbi:MAG: insulinase family protein, partial [Chitinophagaceae bacterium]|nr:insulinase family protein [Chitinophagaceae bacterium]